MTTVLDANVHNIALEGTFDDCQAIVKGLFRAADFRDDMHLSGVNSINWGRIVAQIVYYFTAAVSLGAPAPAGDLRRPHRQFRRHLRRLRGQAHGPAHRQPRDRHQLQRHPRPHPRDRRLRDRHGRPDHQPVDGHPGLVQLRAPAVRGAGPRRRRPQAPDERPPAIRRTSPSRPRPSRPSARALPPAAPTKPRPPPPSRSTCRDSGYLLDPHTAVGVTVARRLDLGDAPVVTLATAHPAKFPAAVKAATGIEPALPAWLSDLYERPERFDVLANDQGAVEAYHSRALPGREELI